MDDDDATLIVPSSPPNDDDNDDNTMENCGVGRIHIAGRGGARVTAEAGVGPGLAWFCRKLLRTAQEEPSQTAAAAAKVVRQGVARAARQKAMQHDSK